MKNLLNLATAFVAFAGWSGVFALDLPELCGDYQLLNSPGYARVPRTVHE